jgi:clorobiocin biosynthesis protein CloN6
MQIPANTTAVRRLPTLAADLLLVHPPAFFDFRNCRNIYFPFLGTSGDVPITPLYEYFPTGFKMFQRYLSDHGHSVEIINLSTLLLRYPLVDFDAVVDALDVRLLGIDLHWMIHVQGSLAVAERIKKRHRDIRIVFGGISSTYYAEELIAYPFIDMVLRGYDTLAPMDKLLQEIKAGRDFCAVPNLTWKSGDGDIHANHYTHRPLTYSVGVDWSSLNLHQINLSLPILEFMSTQNAGCAYNCGWCGGSKEAFRRVFGPGRTMAPKRPAEVRWEFDSIAKVPQRNLYHFYSVGSYNESRQGMDTFLDLVARAGVGSISYEQFYLTPEPTLRRMVEANSRTSITLSPESHDQRISKLSGRGVYSNLELERWIARAIELGIHNVDVWYFVGMPEQDERSVMDTVDYCERLLNLFRSQRVNPLICPMIPYLDPGSTFFTDPDPHGYRVFYRTVEEHRRSAERASLIHRINYETRWLRREELVSVGFRAVRRLMQAKAAAGALPGSWVKTYNNKIDDALLMIQAVHRADCIGDARERARALEAMGDEIQQRNDAILYHGVANQAFLVNRQIGNRWFDEMGWKPEALEAIAAASPPGQALSDQLVK